MKYRALPHTYESYLGDMYYNTHEADHQRAHELLRKFKELGRFNTGSLPLFYIIDYTKQEYILFSDSIRQLALYEPRDFLDGGLEMLKSIFHKDDFAIYNREIFARNCGFLQSVPQSEHEDYIFSYTFRIENKKGDNLCVLQKGSYITSAVTGLPLYSLGTCLDVSDLKQGSRMVHTIEKKKDVNILVSRQIEKNFFYPNAEDALFTRKEKDVLLYMAEGLSAKQIADKLNVAETTVISHRKNMMQKSNAKNAVGLVAHAIRTGII